MGRRSSRKRKRPEIDAATEDYFRGAAVIQNHPMFTQLSFRAQIWRDERTLCPADGWAVVTNNGYIHVHPTRRAEPYEWIYVLAHCLLHLGFEHFREREDQPAWNAACDYFVARFLADLRLGRPPMALPTLDPPLARDEESLYRQFLEAGIPDDLLGCGTAGPNASDMVYAPPEPVYRWALPRKPWAECFSEGIAMAVGQAVEVASGNLVGLGRSKRPRTKAQVARSWFISSYPLLGALAEAFELVEDAQVCIRLGGSVAAVCAEAREIYVNPAAGLTLEEARFVIAHELLHVGLRHDARRQGRDPFLWNVACDYVINGWLAEMQIGDVPRFGGLYDEELKGLSAEAIYDRIVNDLRRGRKLATLAGYGRCDILGPRKPGWWAVGDGISLDDFYRSCLMHGLSYHEEGERGFLPAGLVEEIRALSQPAIPWDVELAQWFDGYFAPLEKRRTYARPSRRQSSTPDIPRPRWVPIEGAEDGRTFGVVLDTSGSMERTLLAKALGAVASYAISRDVPAVRVVFCDAAAYDQGYMSPEAIAERVKVRGRGGTILQPGVNVLEKAEDFPKNGPILIITDGYCDRVRTRHDHAFLLPKSSSLPFVPKGRVFRFS
jgi:predicted metal-dependent peptidase